MDDRFEKLLSIGTADDLKAEILRFTTQLGFATVSLTEVVDNADGSCTFHSVEHMPEAYIPIYEDLSVGHLDPVSQHCKRSSLPIVWNRETYSGQGAQSLWEPMADCGLRQGIALALHLPGGRHCMLGVDTPDERASIPGQLARTVADLQLFAVYAHEAASNVLVPKGPLASVEDAAQLSDLPALSPRELETLKWTMEGKTAWEVGTILGISERTAVQHANNAMQKLNAVNKFQAVVRAMRLGIIR